MNHPYDKKIQQLEASIKTVQAEIARLKAMPRRDFVELSNGSPFMPKLMGGYKKLKYKDGKVQGHED